MPTCNYSTTTRVIRLTSASTTTKISSSPATARQRPRSAYRCSCPIITRCARLPVRRAINAVSERRRRLAFEVGVSLQTLFVEPQQLAGFLVAHAVFADRGFNILAQFRHQRISAELHVLEHF